MTTKAERANLLLTCAAMDAHGAAYTYARGMGADHEKAVRMARRHARGLHQAMAASSRRMARSAA